MIRTLSRLVLAGLFLIAGVIHVVHPSAFLPIVPPWVPDPRLTVIATGWCEIAGAIGLVVPRTRWIAGLMLAIYSACVFPANIQHAVIHFTRGFGTLGWAYHGPRLLLQPVIIWWCLHAGGVIDWPFRRRKS